MTFAPRDLKDVANLVARKLEDYMNNERREDRFQPAGCFRTTKKMQNYDLLTRVMETSDLDYVPAATKRKKSPGRKSPRNQSPEGKVKKMPKFRQKDSSKERQTAKKHKKDKSKEKDTEERKSDSDKRGEVEKRKGKDTKHVKKETWMRLTDAKPESSSNLKLTITPKLDYTSRTVVAKKEAARLSEYASHVFEEQPLDKLHVIHRYRPNSIDVPHVTENGKVQNYTCHFGSALHAKKYVDYYMKEGLQTGKKEYSKRLQHLKTKDTSDKGSERSSVQTEGSASTLRNKDYRYSHNERSRGKFPPIHSSPSDLVSPRSNHSVRSSDSAMSGFSRYTSSSFSSGLPSTYKIMSTSQCPPSTSIQPCPPTRRSYPDPHPSQFQSVDQDSGCSARMIEVRMIPSVRQAFTETSDERKAFMRSLMLDRASSTTDLLPKLDICTQTPRDDEGESCILESGTSVSDTLVNQETQTPRSSRQSSHKKKKKKKHHSKDRKELMIDISDGESHQSDSRHKERTARSLSKHMGISSVSDGAISRTDNENMTNDPNAKTCQASSMKESDSTSYNAKMCQTSFSIASDDWYPNPLSERSYLYSPIGTNTSNMNESLLLQIVEGDNDISSLPNSTVHLYKESLDQDPSDSVFDSEGQNARYASSGVVEENRADIGSSEDYYSYRDRAVEDPEKQKTENKDDVTHEEFVKVSKVDECPQKEPTSSQSNDSLEIRGDKSISFDDNDPNCDVEMKDLREKDDANEEISHVSEIVQETPSSPRDNSVTLTVVETPRNEEALKVDPPEKPVNNEETVADDLLSESFQDVCRGAIEMTSIDEDPRGDTLFSDIDEMKEEYLGNFNSQIDNPAIYRKLNSDYKYVAEDRGCDGEAFGDSDPEPEVYTKADSLIQKEENDDNTEINIEVCRGSIPPKRKESNASSCFSTTRAVADIFPMNHEEHFERPSSRCSQVSSLRGSGKNSSQKDQSLRLLTGIGEQTTTLNETQDLLTEEEMIELTKTDEVPKSEEQQIPERRLSSCSRGSGDTVLVDWNTALRGQDGQTNENTTFRGQDGQMNEDTTEMAMNLPEDDPEEDNVVEKLYNSSASRGTHAEVNLKAKNEETILQDNENKKKESDQKAVQEEPVGTVLRSADENQHGSDTSSYRGSAGKSMADSVVSSRGLDEDASFERLNVKEGRVENSDYGSMVLTTDDLSSGPGMESRCIQEVNTQSKQLAPDMTTDAHPFVLTDESFRCSSRGVVRGNDYSNVCKMYAGTQDDVMSLQKPSQEENMKPVADLREDRRQSLVKITGEDTAFEPTNDEKLDVSEILGDSMCVLERRGNPENDLTQASVDMNITPSLDDLDQEEKEGCTLNVQMNTTDDHSTQRPSSAHSSQSSEILNQRQRPQSACPMGASVIEKPILKKFSKTDESEAVVANGKTEEVDDEDMHPMPTTQGNVSVVLNESRGTIEHSTGDMLLSKDSTEQREDCISKEPVENRIKHTIASSYPQETTNKGISNNVRLNESDVVSENNKAMIEKEVGFPNVGDSLCVQEKRSKPENDVLQAYFDTNNKSFLNDLDNKHSTMRPSSAHSPRNFGDSAVSQRPQSAHPLATSEKLVLKEFPKSDDSEAVGSNGKAEQIPCDSSCSVQIMEGYDSVALDESRGNIEHPTGISLPSKDTTVQKEDCIEEKPVKCDKEHMDEVKLDTSEISSKLKENEVSGGVEVTIVKQTGFPVEENPTSTSCNPIEVTEDNDHLELTQEHNQLQSPQDQQTLLADQECSPSALSTERGDTTNTPRVVSEPVVKKLERSASVCSRGSVSEDNDCSPNNTDNTNKTVHIIHDKQDNPAADKMGSGEYEYERTEKMGKPLEEYAGKEPHGVQSVEDMTVEGDTADPKKEPVNSTDQVNYREDADENLSRYLHTATHRGSITHRDAVLGRNTLVNGLSIGGSDDIESEKRDKPKEKVGTEEVLQDEQVITFPLSPSEDNHFAPTEGVKMESEIQEKTKETTDATPKSVESTALLLHKEPMNFFIGDEAAGDTLSSSFFTEDQTFLQSSMLSEDMTLLQSSMDGTNDSVNSNSSSTSSGSETIDTPESLQYIRTDEITATQTRMDQSENPSVQQYEMSINVVEQSEETVPVKSTEHEEDICQTNDELNSLIPNGTPVQQERKGCDDDNESSLDDKNGPGTIKPTSVLGLQKDTSSHTESRRYSMESRGSQDPICIAADTSELSPRGDETMSTVNQNTLPSENIPQSEMYINGSSSMKTVSVASEDENLSYCNLASSSPPQDASSVESDTKNDGDPKKTQKDENISTTSLPSPRTSITNNSEGTTLVISADAPTFVAAQQLNTDKNEYHLVLNGKGIQDMPESTEGNQEHMTSTEAPRNENIEKQLMDNVLECSEEINKMRQCEQANSSSPALEATSQPDPGKIPESNTPEIQDSMVSEGSDVILEPAVTEGRVASGSRLGKDTVNVMPEQKVILVSEMTETFVPATCLLNAEGTTEASCPVKSSKSDLVHEASGDPLSVIRSVASNESTGVEDNQQESSQGEQNDVLAGQDLKTETALQTKAVEQRDMVVTDNMTESGTAVNDESKTKNNEILSIEETQKIEPNTKPEGVVNVVASSGRRGSETDDPSDTSQQSSDQTPGHRIILVSENIPSPMPTARVIERSPGAPRIILVSEKSQN